MRHFYQMIHHHSISPNPALRQVLPWTSRQFIKGLKYWHTQAQPHSAVQPTQPEDNHQERNMATPLVLALNWWSYVRQV